MTTLCKISCLTAIATLVFILAPAANHCAAEDPPATIAEQNLFKPERNEGVPEKPDPAKIGKKADASNLELYGTIILGDKKSALIFDNSKRYMDGAQKQEKNKRAGVYYLGDSLGGYVISAIEEKRVVFDYYGEEVILTLREGKKTTRGDYTPLEEEKSEPPASAKRKPRVKEEAPEKQDGKKPGSVPKARIKSPIMSLEETEEIVEFSKEILADMEKGGENADQGVIDLKKEELRKMFLEKLERAEKTGKEVR